MELRPIQAGALEDLSAHGGFLGNSGVGFGKTLVSWLAPTVWAESRRPVLMTRAALRDAFLDAGRDLRKHWNIRADIQVVSYEALSQPSTSGVLDAAPVRRIGGERAAEEFLPGQAAQYLVVRRYALQPTRRQDA